jgi:hypothetical protein
MNCTHRNAIREEREAIAAWLTNRGQKWAADRIIAGEHRMLSEEIIRMDRDEWSSEPVRYRENDEPMRCAECNCANGGADCNWIKTPEPVRYQENDEPNYRNDETQT